MFYAILNLISPLAASRQDMISWFAKGYRAYDGEWINFDSMKASINKKREDSQPHPGVGVKPGCEHTVGLVDCTAYSVGHCGSVIINGLNFDLQNYLWSLYCKLCCLAPMLPHIYDANSALACPNAFLTHRSQTMLRMSAELKKLTSNRIAFRSAQTRRRASKASS